MLQYGSTKCAELNISDQTTSTSKSTGKNHKIRRPQLTQSNTE